MWKSNKNFLCHHRLIKGLNKNSVIPHLYILVGSSATPLKNMKVNWDDEIPNIWENKIDVPNHQPVYIYTYIYIHIYIYTSIYIYTHTPSPTCPVNFTLRLIFAFFPCFPLIQGTSLRWCQALRWGISPSSSHLRKLTLTDRMIPQTGARIPTSCLSHDGPW